MAGYSGTPLPKKLGIKQSSRVAAIDAPPEFAGLVDGVALSSQLRGRFDVIVFFTTDRKKLERRLGALTRALEQNGGLWIAWPKKASKVPTDMTEDVVREVALPTGLVDNKVCAIDDVWSGLRLVIRVEHRL
ncbi:MAG: hypothetical protein QOE35_906 [Actinomycetota bacterium]|jgi:hypothetical protein